MNDPRPPVLTPATTPGAGIQPPSCLLRQEPAARYALWNSGHLLIVKGDKEVSLTRDDLDELRRYFDLFADGGNA